MNNRDKLQKFSIRKYAIGTFSTVIATLVFIGFNAGQAQANESDQPATIVKKTALNGDEKDSTAKQQTNSKIDQNKNDVYTISENNTELLTNVQTSISNSDETQKSAKENTKNSPSNYLNDKNSHKVKTQAVKSLIDDKEKQKDNLKEKSITNKQSTKEDSNNKQIEDTYKPKFVQPPLDKTRLQALYDASYHEYRMIDTDKANTDEYNKVKATFDKLNDYLGNNDNPESKQLDLMYQQLEQAIELARTLPTRTTKINKNNRSTRSVNKDRASSKSNSAYLDAWTEYYVSSDDDGSGYPIGTFLHASNKGAPYLLPSTPYNTLHASDVKGIAYITAKRVKDGYEWDILFNKGHSNHENMIYWFGIPRDQTPVGQVTFSIINKNGTSTAYGGVGSGSGAPLPKFWQTADGIKPSVANYFRHGAAHGYPFYNTPTVHINNFWDFARGSNEYDRNSYFNRNGASSTARYYGDENFAFLNGEKPEQGQGLDSIYSFIGKGDVSYRISFKTNGLPTERLYYAAGGRALEFRQLFNYNQLYVEPMKEYQNRIQSFVEVKNRTMHLGNTKYVYDPSIGKNTDRAILDSDGDHTIDYADDPLSYVKHISQSIFGFMQYNDAYDQVRIFGADELNPVEIESTFSKNNLEEAARTGNPIKLMIGFNARDRHHNPETLVPVNLYVKPALKQKISYWHNNEGQSIESYSESKKAGHPVYEVMAGNMHNNSPKQQDIRVQLTSNEPIRDNTWSVYGYPNTLRLEESKGQTNNANEKNFSLVGTLAPGDYFITVRLGDREEQFEVRAKPNPPTIETTEMQLRGKAGQKPEIIVTNVPHETNAKVLLVVGGQNGSTDPFSDPYTKPENYTVIASADATHTGTVTFTASDYIQGLPRAAELKAITYFNENVQSNFSNIITLSSDSTPPTFGEPVGLNAKYYRDNHVSFSIPVTENHGGSGLNQVRVEGLPSGWTQTFVKNSNNETGTLTVSGTISRSQALNSVISLRLTATDNDNNQQTKTINVNVGSLATDYPLTPLSAGNRILVVNPTNFTTQEKNQGKDKVQRLNTNKSTYLASSNALVPQDNGNILVNYKDGSQGTVNAGNIYTYDPIRKDIYADTDVTDPKIATIFVPKGSRYEIGRDLRKYFSLSNGQDIPTNTTFTVMYPNDTLPTGDQIAHFGNETHSYSITAVNAYNQNATTLTLRVKAVDVIAPSGNLRVYRLNPSTLSDEEVNKVKQAFVEANRRLDIQLSDITVNNPTSGGASTVNVVVRKDKYNKTFTSHPGDMNFLRWTNIRDDYTISWSNDKIAHRDTDGGLSWSPDHKSIIYRYDATKGSSITLNQILPLLTARTSIPSLRNDISGDDKALAIAGGTPKYKTTGFSTKLNTLDNLRFYTKDGQVIQVLDLVQASTGIENAEVSHSNSIYNERNSQVSSGEVPAANGAQAFNVDKVIKANGSNNGVMGVIYKAQLVLTPYGAKQYIDNITDSTDDSANLMEVTNNVIDVYFVPSDNVKPVISFGNYNNHVVFSGETFRNNMTVTDNYGVQSVSIPQTSDIAVSKNNSNTEITGTAPNVTSQTTKAVKVIATDKSNNQTEQSFNVLIKPLKDKYHVTSSSTIQNPIRISSIRNGTTLTQTEKNTVINSLTITNNEPNRTYVTAPKNEIRSKEVSNVTNTNNNSSVTVTITYADNTTSQINVLVKQIIPEIFAEPRYTVQGQNFPEGKGANPKDFFKLKNGSPIEARLTWVNNRGPNINSNQIGVEQNLEADILFDGESTPIRKSTSYKIVKSQPKRIFETTINGQFVFRPDNADFAGSYVQPFNHSWTQGMNFEWGDNLGTPSSRTPGAFTRVATVIYPNGERENVNVLYEVKPNKPVIDSNSVIYRGGLTHQQILVRNVPNNANVSLYQSNGSIIQNTTQTVDSNGVATVTIQGILPTGNITAKVSITENNLTYAKVTSNGVNNVTENITVTSDASNPVNVTEGIHAKNGGIKFVKGSNFNFNNFNNFISNAPSGSQFSWVDSPDTWKNTIGESEKVINVTLPNHQGTRTVNIPVMVYPTISAVTPNRDKFGIDLSRGTDVNNYIIFEGNNRYGATTSWKDNRQPDKNVAGIQNLTALIHYPGIDTPVEVPVKVWVYKFDFANSVYKIQIGQTFPGGTWVKKYVHLENGDDLPTNGFLFYWNPKTTGSNTSQWQSLAYTSQTFVKTGTYDVLDAGGHPWQESQPGTFIVTSAQPNNAIITESNSGEVTITPGAVREVPIEGTTSHTQSIADKIIINKNGHKLTTFIKNNEGRWIVQNGEPNVRGVLASDNGSSILINRPDIATGDTLQALATEGSGETISPTAESGLFTVKAPQPEQASAKVWENGTFEITPDNRAHSNNPTAKVEVTYTEKLENSHELSKSFTVTHNNNGTWSITNKPSYVSFNQSNGIIIFNANSIKPESQVTIISRAGSGNTESSSTNTVAAPPLHTVVINEIIKEQG
ncbi:hyperosmolarity resistance protein Ebh [Staphylococcus capitis]|uniref:hyperosmolarity resistance protein Ebh n=1 Tax=Staphylococcus capitis TaxID=29388 RepID=UPI000B29C317|nr:hyperosmolarity resistance protein Ebh [Staphylococcus capitis]